MTILCRIGRLFKADLHGILDNLEEPGLLLKQSIRDMEEEIAKEAEGYQDLDRRESRLRTALQSYGERAEQIAAQIELCFTNQNDELARACVRRKLETEAEISRLQKTAERIQAAKARVEASLSSKREQLARVVEKAEALGADFKHEQGKQPGSCGHEGVREGTRVTDEDVELAFLAEKQRRREDARHAGPNVRTDAEREAANR